MNDLIISTVCIFITRNMQSYFITYLLYPRMSAVFIGLEIWMTPDWTTKDSQILRVRCLGVLRRSSIDLTSCRSETQTVIYIFIHCSVLFQLALPMQLRMFLVMKVHSWRGRSFHLCRDIHRHDAITRLRDLPTAAQQQKIISILGCSHQSHENTSNL